jgi:hypothetical protein
VRFADLRYGTVKADGGRERVWPEIGFGMGVNRRRTTTFFASHIGPSDLRTRRSTLNWQNDWMLTHGQWPLDVALHTQWIRDPHGGEAAFEVGPALQTDAGRTGGNTSFFFERNRADGPWQLTRLKSQRQLRHRWRPGLHCGAQGFGELGRWDDWAPASRQSHRAGPAASSPAGRWPAVARWICRRPGWWAAPADSMAACSPRAPCSASERCCSVRPPRPACSFARSC